MSNLSPDYEGTIKAGLLEKRKDADEYGKTVIDYALEYENYDFLKYLTEKKYIWFVGKDEIDFQQGNKKI